MHDDAKDINTTNTTNAAEKMPVNNLITVVAKDKCALIKGKCAAIKGKCGGTKKKKCAAMMHRCAAKQRKCECAAITQSSAAIED